MQICVSILFLVCFIFVINCPFTVIPFVRCTPILITKKMHNNNRNLLELGFLNSRKRRLFQGKITLGTKLGWAGDLFCGSTVEKKAYQWREAYTRQRQKRRVATRPTTIGRETSRMGRSGEGASPGGFSGQFPNGRQWLTTAEGG